MGNWEEYKWVLTNLEKFYDLAFESFIYKHTLLANLILRILSD